MNDPVRYTDKIDMFLEPAVNVRSDSPVCASESTAHGVLVLEETHPIFSVSGYQSLNPCLTAKPYDDGVLALHVDAAFMMFHVSAKEMCVSPK